MNILQLCPHVFALRPPVLPPMLFGCTPIQKTNWNASAYRLQSVSPDPGSERKKVQVFFLASILTREILVSSRFCLLRKTKCLNSSEASFISGVDSELIFLPMVGFFCLQDTGLAWLRGRCASTCLRPRTAGATLWPPQMVPRLAKNEPSV